MGNRILNYLDNWLILAQSEAVLTWYNTLLLSHLHCLGLRFNFAKSILSPSQRVSFLGTVIDSVQMTATVSAEQATTIQHHAASFEEGTARPLKAFQRMLGLMAVASPVLPYKRVGDLQALSINPACLEFWPNDSKVVLEPRLGYVPKVLSTPFRAQVIALTAHSPSTGSQELFLLFPVRALRVYIERSASYRKSEPLFVGSGNHAKVGPVTMQARVLSAYLTILWVHLTNIVQAPPSLGLSILYGRKVSTYVMTPRPRMTLWLSLCLVYSIDSPGSYSPVRLG